MKKYIYKISILVISSFLIGLPQFAMSSGQIFDIQTKAFKEKTVLDKDKSQMLESVKEANDGDIIVYKITAQNVSKVNPDVGSVKLKNPVPKGTFFVENSATCANCTVLYSVDGIMFLPLADLKVKKEYGGSRQATNFDISYVQFLIHEPTPPKYVGSFSYKVKVDSKSTTQRNYDVKIKKNYVDIVKYFLQSDNNLITSSKVVSEMEDRGDYLAQLETQDEFKKRRLRSENKESIRPYYNTVKSDAYSKHFKLEGTLQTTTQKYNFNTNELRFSHHYFDQTLIAPKFKPQDKRLGHKLMIETTTCSDRQISYGKSIKEWRPGIYNLRIKLPPNKAENFITRAPKERGRAIFKATAYGTLKRHLYSEGQHFFVMKVKEVHVFDVKTGELIAEKIFDNSACK